MNLARDELSERKVFQELIESEKLKIVFRPGNRIFPNPKGYKVNEIVTIRIVTKPGDDELNRPPIFNNFKKRVRIKNITVKDINELDDDDFISSYPTINNTDLLKYHLGLIYNLSPSDITEISKIELEYV